MALSFTAVVNFTVVIMRICRLLILVKFFFTLDPSVFGVLRNDAELLKYDNLLLKI